MTETNPRAEWDAMLAELPDGLTPHDAAVLLDRKLADAVQAQRDWAADRLTDARLRGLARMYTQHRQSKRPRVRTTEGRSVKQVGGARRRDHEGRVQHVQMPYELMTFEQLFEHLDSQARNRRSLSDNISALTRLADLQKRAPEAETPAEAMEILGLQVENVLAGAS